MAVRCCTCRLPLHDEECAWACGEVVRLVGGSQEWRSLCGEYGRAGRDVPGAAILTLGSLECRRCHQRTWEEYEPASGKPVAAQDMPRWVRLAGAFTGTTLRFWLGGGGHT